jgi:hypothetical protein
MRVAAGVLSIVRAGDEKRLDWLSGLQWWQDVRSPALLFILSLVATVVTRSLVSCR